MQMEKSREPTSAETGRQGPTAKESIDAWDANGNRLSSYHLVSGRYKYDGSKGRFYLEESYDRSGAKGVAYLTIHHFENAKKKAVSGAVDTMTLIVTANNGKVVAKVTGKPTACGTRQVQFCTLENEANIREEEAVRTDIEFPSVPLLALEGRTFPDGSMSLGDIENLVRTGVGNVTILAKRKSINDRGNTMAWAAHDYGEGPYYATFCARKRGEPVAFVRIDSLENADRTGRIRPRVLYLGRNRYEADLQISKEAEKKCNGFVDHEQTGAAALLAAGMTDHQLVEILDERRSRLMKSEIGRQKLARWDALIDRAHSMQNLMPALKRLAADVRAIQDEHFENPTEDIALLGRISGSRLRTLGGEDAKLSQIEAWLKSKRIDEK
ncbi:MAG: hypothetical protein EOM92_14475 [Gammaproteobacteria bacterium]|nr:hypothetical protein [Gammaproteobacteria bacterium]